MKNRVTASEIKTALSKRHESRGDFYLTEVHTGPLIQGVKILDAVGIKKSWSKPCITGYEIKVSRNDFLRDSKWSSYLPYCSRFNFVCPKGLITEEDLPKGYGIGLIWYNPEKKSLYTKKTSIFKPVKLDADFFYYIIMSRLDNDRIPFYSNQKEYLEDYLKNKEENKRIGGQVSSKMTLELSRLRSENRELKQKLESMTSDITIYEAIKKTIEDCGIRVPRLYNFSDSLQDYEKERLGEFCNKLSFRLQGNSNSSVHEKIRKVIEELSDLNEKV